MTNPPLCQHPPDEVCRWCDDIPLNFPFHITGSHYPLGFPTRGSYAPAIYYCQCGYLPHQQGFTHSEQRALVDWHFHRHETQFLM